MKTGTKSVLFGVHQFLWHPWTVALSWRLLYGVWPNWWESITIFFHDVGYVGCEKMDDEVGQEHPVAGAYLAAQCVGRLYLAATYLRHPIRSHCDEAFIWQRWFDGIKLKRKVLALAFGHSRYYAKKHHIEVSRLFKADKLCTRFDPPWFYLLRAKASGEVYEYVARSPLGLDVTPEQWYEYYRNIVEEKFA